MRRDGLALDRCNQQGVPCCVLGAGAFEENNLSWSDVGRLILFLDSTALTFSARLPDVPEGFVLYPQVLPCVLVTRKVELTC